MHFHIGWCRANRSRDKSRGDRNILFANLCLEMISHGSYRETFQNLFLFIFLQLQTHKKVTPPPITFFKKLKKIFFIKNVEMSLYNSRQIMLEHKIKPVLCKNLYRFTLANDWRGAQNWHVFHVFGPPKKITGSQSLIFYISLL